MDIVSNSITIFIEVEEEGNRRSHKLSNHDEIIKELKSGL